MCTAASSATKTTADARRSRAAEKLRGHRLRISVISELYHTWMNAVMRAEGSLDANSLPLLPQEDSAAFLLDRFRKLWMGSLGQATGDGRTVRRVVVRLLQPRFGLIGLWNVLDACSNFAQPIIVATLVRDLRLRSADRLGWDFALVGLLTLTSLGGAVSSSSDEAAVGSGSDGCAWAPADPQRRTNDVTTMSNRRRVSNAGATMVPHRSPVRPWEGERHR